VELKPSDGVDKLGVTGSSPVPPTSKGPGNGTFFVWRRLGVRQTGALPGLTPLSSSNQAFSFTSQRVRQRRSSRDPGSRSEKLSPLPARAPTTYRLQDAIGGRRSGLGLISVAAGLPRRSRRMVGLQYVVAVDDQTLARHELDLEEIAGNGNDHCLGPGRVVPDLG